MHAQPSDALPKIMLARYYGANLPRFLSPDPFPGKLGDPQSWNAYAYVSNNPLTLTDPTGMYGINPNPYNPSGSNPCDNLGPLCEVEVKDQDTKDYIEERKKNDPDFAEQYGELDRKRDKIILEVVENDDDIYIDSNAKGKTGKREATMILDRNDLDQLPDDAGDSYTPTKPEAILHAVEEGFLIARGEEKGRAHDSAILGQNRYRNRQRRAPIAPNGNTFNESSRTMRVEFKNSKVLTIQWSGRTMVIKVPTP